MDIKPEKLDRLEELRPEFDTDKNECGIDECGYNDRVWWVCPLGHSYNTLFTSRLRLGSNCPVCANKEVLKGFNDLESRYPGIAAEWHPTMNSCRPDEVMFRTTRKVWWLCPEGHEYKISVESRTRNHTGCPICANKVVLKGFNDLATKFPGLADEWDDEKNGCGADEIVFGSAKQAWWKCAICGHEWKAYIRNRTLQGTGCPECKKAIRTSYPEQIVYQSIAAKLRALNRAKAGGYEYDVYIPELKLAIEYDGVYFHSDNKHEERFEVKKEFARVRGVRLIRILEVRDGISHYHPGTDTIYYLFSRNQYSNIGDLIELLNQVIFEGYGVDLALEVDDDVVRKAKAESVSVSPGNSFGEVYPELLKLWDYEKNEGIDPFKLHKGSNLKVWFKCPVCGNEFLRMACRAQAGCTACKPGGKGIASGTNDLLTMFPQIALEWAYDLNPGVDPTKLSGKAAKKAWWRCSHCGWEWSTYISNRTQKKSGCPHCHYRVLLDESLKDLKPEDIRLTEQEEP